MICGSFISLAYTESTQTVDLSVAFTFIVKTFAFISLSVALDKKMKSFKVKEIYTKSLLQILQDDLIHLKLQ